MVSGSFSRILLTGASGFVGGYLAPRLAQAFPEARRWLTTRPDSQFALAGWEPIAVDSTDPQSIDACIRGAAPDLVVHLAAQSSVAAGIASGERTWRTNFGFSFELASACARAAPDATFFFVSSSEVYGKSFNLGMVDETTPLRPVNAYARSKAAVETTLFDVLSPGNHAIIARPFNHTGPGQDRRFAIPSFLAQIAQLEQREGEGRIEVGNVDVERDFLDVRDVCDAYLALLRLPRNPGWVDIYNVASGHAHKLSEILEIMRSLSRRNFLIEISPKLLRPADVPVANGLNAKLANATDWRPRYDLRQTLDNTLEYWRRQVAAGACE